MQGHAILVHMHSREHLLCVDTDAKPGIRTGNTESKGDETLRSFTSLALIHFNSAATDAFS